MKALTVLLTLLSLPILLLNFCGLLVGGIWLACLGQWALIGLGLILLFSATWLLSFIMMPGLLFAIPSARAIAQNKTTTGILFGAGSILYSTAVVVAWAYTVLWYSHTHTPKHGMIPIMLWSYGIAVSPWMFFARQDQQNPEGNTQSIWAAFALALSYVACITLLILKFASINTCFWILVIVSALAAIWSFFSLLAELAKIKGQAQYDAALAQLTKGTSSLDT